MEEDFDVAVVGGGIAGCITAYQLARAGHSVILVERGEHCGSKNLSGGVFYCRVLSEIFPNFFEEAPIERIIDRNIISFLNEDSRVSLDYHDSALSEPVNAVTVLRSKFDAWLAEKCEEAGVMVMPEVKADALVLDRDKNGAVCGIKIGEDELPAKIVVVAEGVNAFLPEAVGLKSKPKPNTLAVGVKSIIKLSEETINERFNTDGKHGSAFAVVGDCTAGVAGGGFLYTNKDSVSVGVVLRLDSLTDSSHSASELHDRFINHPLIAPYLQGGELLEYGCHLIAEGGKPAMPKLVYDGMLLVGDAAGLTLNTGFTVRGMDLAAGSAMAAARAIEESLQTGDYSAANLGIYEKYLDESFVGKDMQTYRNAPAFFHNEELYGQVGKLARNILFDVFNHDLQGRRPLRKIVWQAFRGGPLKMKQLVQLGWQGMRSL